MGRVKQFFSEVFGNEQVTEDNSGPSPEHDGDRNQPMAHIKAGSPDHVRSILRAINGLADDDSVKYLLESLRTDHLVYTYNYINYIARAYNDGESVKFTRLNRIENPKRFFMVKNYLVNRGSING